MSINSLLNDVYVCISNNNIYNIELYYFFTSKFSWILCSEKNPTLYNQIFWKILLEDIKTKSTEKKFPIYYVSEIFTLLGLLPLLGQINNEYLKYSKCYESQ